ncbi:homing endonuclease associated repeat-containing protein [Natrinema versiforme]|uniref:HNH endonuclease n=1 Tax=Natrinema versiforme JCM 10478 TaxID=1227496 RepID=L9Y458_9EURY|nr:HNH endonuclease [Natrinema versiforme]ELY68850.1 HNH endonuclease [Natrinema versiforme JCM 10478]
MPAKITRADLVAELERLAADLDKTPTTTDVREHAEYSYQPYSNEFDSFDDALAAANLEREPRQQGPSRDELLEAIRELAAEIDGTPTKVDMNDRGRFSTQPYYNKFDGWNDAVERADLEPNHREDIADDELLQSLRDAADELGRDPLAEEISELTGHAHTTYVRRFGSWLEAREQAGLSGTQQSYGRRVDRDDLLDDLERLGEIFGRAPTKPELEEYGRHSPTPYYREFDTLRNALETAGFELDTPDRTWPNDYPSDWLDRADRVRDRDGNECVVCGMGSDEHESEYGQQLHVHHVATDDGDPDDLENLVTLCKSCHSKWDRVKADPRDADNTDDTPASAD